MRGIWIQYTLYFIMGIFLKTTTQNNKYKVIKMESNFIRKNSHSSSLCTWISLSTIHTEASFSLLSSIPEADRGREEESKEGERKGWSLKLWLLKVQESSLLLLIFLVHHCPPSITVVALVSRLQASRWSFAFLSSLIDLFRNSNI